MASGGRLVLKKRINQIQFFFYDMSQCLIPLENQAINRYLTIYQQTASDHDPDFLRKVLEECIIIIIIIDMTKKFK